MDKSQTAEERAIAEMPAFLAAAVERDEGLRFTALGLLDRARGRFEDAAVLPPADGPAAALAALSAIHLAARSLLAARGIRSFSARASLFLLRTLYPADIPEPLTTRLMQIQNMTLQGPEALQTAMSFVALAEKLLSKSAQ